jgi:hypothetical protein
MAMVSLLSFINIPMHIIGGNAHIEVGDMHSAFDDYYTVLLWPEYVMHAR